MQLKQQFRLVNRFKTFPAAYNARKKSWYFHCRLGRFSFFHIFGGYKFQQVKLSGRRWAEKIGGKGSGARQ